MNAASPKSWRLALGGLIAMGCAVGIGRFIYTPILPPMVEDLALSKGQAGLIASANFIGYLTGALAVAMVVRTQRGWLVAMLAASAATTLAMAWPSSMPVFLILRFLGGVASAFVLVLASSLVLERLARSGRGDLAAVHFGGVGTGIALSAAVTWAIDANGLGWRAMWLGGGLIALAGALAAPALIQPAGPSDGPAPAALAGSGRSRGIARMAVAYGLFGFGYVITATFIVDIVRGSAHARAAEPLIWLVLGLAAAPSVVGWVAASRRVGVLTAFSLACILEAIGIVFSVAWTTLPGLFLSAALLGGTFMGLTALGLIAGRELTSGSRRAVALMTAAFGAGQILGPVVAGYGYDLTGSFVLPSLLAAAGLLIGAGLAFSIRPQAAR